MNTTDKIAIGAAIIAGCGVVVPLVQIAINHWYRKVDESPKVTAKIQPHIFLGPDGKPYLYGMAVLITSRRKEPAEIIDVRLRLTGVDVTNDFMKGFSNAKMVEKSPNARRSDSGIDVHLRFEHEGKQLIINSNDSRGLPVGKNKTARFFTPLPLPNFIQALFNDAKDADLSIVARMLPGDDITTLVKGRQIKSLLEAILDAHANKPVDPRYEWNIGLFTPTKYLPDTLPIGQINDKPIVLNP